MFNIVMPYEKQRLNVKNDKKMQIASSKSY